MDPTPARITDDAPLMGFREFVTLMAALMAINALSIDAMLPVLPQIGETLSLTSENDQQWVVTAFLLGFGVALGLMIWIWAWWNDRKKKAEAAAAVVPTSTYGRPLVKKG